MYQLLSIPDSIWSTCLKYKLLSGTIMGRFRITVMKDKAGLVCGEEFVNVISLLDLLKKGFYKDFERHFASYTLMHAGAHLVFF